MPWLLRMPGAAAMCRLAGTAVLAAAALLAGCAADLPRLDPPAPAAWRHPGGDGAAAPDLRGWWHAFNDPQLDALVDRALAGNLDVAQAREHLLAARALHSHVGANYLPRLRVRTDQAIAPDASASFFLIGFDSVWELGLFGRADSSERLARGELDGAAADLAAVRVSLTGEVVRQWITLRSAQQQVQLLTQVREARQRQLDLLETRQRLQLAPADAVARAQAALADATAALAEPQQAIDGAAERLAVLLGRNAPDPAWLQPGPPPALGDWRLTTTPADLLRTRPEIAQAEARVLRAAGEAGLAHAALYPSLALGGSIMWSNNIASHRRTHTNAIPSFGPLIDIPLFDWGLRVSQSHAKQHELQAAVYAYRQAVLEGVAEVETALGRLERQREVQQQAGLAAAALRRADEAVAQRVALRLASPLDRQDSLLACAQADAARLAADTARDLDYVALFKALGGAPLPNTDEARR
ncbi:TolC family protein [Frateuria defendens]|uniref:TolC family protein n=1 Tax=Frateuria defendens TaxID=2219559 RepID=UPI0009E3F60F|nr:TolC family protein [Frateuria defendens]